jgi:FKBP-type peptidyl-prolyl cis-trans isomerase FkpA
MSLSLHAVARLTPAVILSLLALPASGATPRKPPASMAARRPTPANNAIIPLPLNPFIPAGQRLCANRTPAGLGYTMLRPATGSRPGASDLVLVNYIGYLAATGEVFDQGQRSALSVDGVIPGFSQGLQMMSRASVARLCIPAALGYGAQGTGPIPANADLVFQIELVDFRSAADPANKPATAPTQPDKVSPPQS